MAAIKRRVVSDDRAAIALAIMIGLLLAFVSCGRSVALPPLPIKSHPELKVITQPVDPCAREGESQ